MKYFIAALAAALISLQASAGPVDRSKEEYIKETGAYIKGAIANLIKYEDVRTPLAGFVKSMEKIDDNNYAIEVTPSFFSYVGPPTAFRGNDPALLCVFKKSDAKKLDINQRINFTAVAKQVTTFQEQSGSRVMTVRAVVATCSL